MRIYRRNAAFRRVLFGVRVPSPIHPRCNSTCRHGWKATIDGKETPIFRTNYVLRGLEIPAGKHTIEFKFEPEVVKTGSTIALMSSIAMLLLIGAGVYFENKKKKSVQ